MAPVVVWLFNHWYHTKFLYGTGGCMTLPLKSMEIHQRLGHHKTLMNGNIGNYLKSLVLLICFHIKEMFKLCSVTQIIAEGSWLQTLTAEFVFIFLIFSIIFSVKNWVDNVKGYWHRERQILPFLSTFGQKTCPFWSLDNLW